MPITVSDTGLRAAQTIWFHRAPAIALLLGLAIQSAGAARAEVAVASGWPARVTATYDISFAGVDIGKMQFQSTATDKGYQAQSSAQLSLLMGVYKWKGSTSASGMLSTAAATPASYAFDFKSNSKTGAVRLAFDRIGVSKVTLQPPSSPSPEHVPLKEQHFKGVLDPLTAVLALTRTGAANPCGRTISIFDGKQRFDLVMTFRRQQRIVEAKPSGQPALAFVCAVRFVPIAGHRPNRENKEMAVNDGIEISLRPIPSAGLVVPYQVTIPTSFGTAVLKARRVEIATPGKSEIALVH